jgi:hypothetical protein
MPIRQEVEVFEDPTFHRQRRAGMYGWGEHGFSVLDSRRVLLGASPTSLLQIGTPEEPVTWDNPVRVWFRDVGPIDPVADPFALGHGLVWHGRHQFYAEPVQPYAALLRDPKKDDTELLLQAPPANWVPGQRVVVADMRRDYHADHQNEVRAIKSVSGQVVTLDAPLLYDHPTVRSDELMGWLQSNVIAEPVVGNLSQPITFESERRGDTPADVACRGHIMWMHNKAGDARGVAAVRVGRVDKRRVLTDPVPGDPASYDNPRGRYAWHYHRQGGSVDEAPATLDGFVIWDSPGLGLVNHSSHVVAKNGFTYDVLGSHLFGETGSEIGSFEDCLCLYARGSGRGATGDAITASTDPRILKDDFGDGGHLVWIEGGGIKVRRVRGGGSAAAALATFSNFSSPGLSFEPFKLSNLDPDLRAYFADTTGTLHPALVPYRVSGCVFWGAAEGLNTWFLNNPASRFPQDRLWDSTFDDSKWANHFFVGYSGHLAFTGCYIGGYYHSLINYAIRMKDCLIEAPAGAASAITLAMEDTNSGDPLANGGGAPSVYENVRVKGDAVLWSSQNRKRTVVLKNVTFATGGFVYTLERFNFQFGALADPGRTGYWDGTHPDSVTGLFDTNVPVLHRLDTVTFDGKYASPDELDPDYKWGRFRSMPAEVRLNPDGTERTTRDFSALAQYVGGRRLPADVTRLPGHRAVFHAAPADRAPPVGVLSLKTTDAATYTLRVRDTAGAEHRSAPATLAAGFQSVVVPGVDGFARGVWVNRVPPAATKPTGPWPDLLGKKGYVVADGAEDVPPGASVRIASQYGLYRWAQVTDDPRALAKDRDTTLRGAAAWTGQGDRSYEMRVRVTPGDATKVTLFLLDYPRSGWGQSVVATDVATGRRVGASYSLTDLTGGVYVTYDVAGETEFYLSRLSGGVLLSAVFLDGADLPPVPQPPPDATPPPTPIPVPDPTPNPEEHAVPDDLTTQGSWLGKYGSDGALVLPGRLSPPAYATVTPAGKADYAWQAATADPRAPQTPDGASRTAGCWYGDTFTIRVSPADGKVRRVGLYLLDWDKQGRAQTVEALDASGKPAADVRTVTDFVAGKWLFWDVTGDTTFRLTKKAGPNAVVSAVVFDTPAPPPPPAPTVSVTADPASGQSPLAVSFKAVTADAAGVAWEFGDGGTGTTAAVTHTYAAAGTFTAKATATGPGGSATATAVVTVAAPPPPAVARVVGVTLPGSGPVRVTHDGQTVTVEQKG